ncbi:MULTISPECIES: tripartite tricarboxylate transporter substrate binding protein [Achromobacter]|uniref:Tripartite tricarboxylate transporter substrate binding protein n=1 Tax=Alcaligenes xylosoxydans xylosoxydans TaxID=85698 RepID=A0A424WCT5_ALCXX|nr:MULTISPECIES: tripartite tricarboxylate transporter substrate binding protein [Achromobacter]MBC9903315.1 tripartite tricarboxylate transporter substrate binding protein [Achromobacter xylosoxidans]MBD0867198.1 tripartite tricarboxylate transporter substrate binding protein [Achromobacter xylosoxidans]MDH1300151.1 tripartite tricarboxylate transporter substrate binding protein [Achromobacter sp. GD03932]QNP88231.1 tripartite tricarboxylate transporter substrate binding protein [Achromobacter
MQQKKPAARARLAILAAAGALAVLPGMLMAQGADWPAKQIKLVVPFPAGGSTDSVGRLLAAELSKELGQTVVVENKGGANGNIGSDMVAKAEPDGYTLLLSGVGSNAISYAVYQNMPYRDSDFAHISLLATGPNVLVANNDFPGKTFAEFIKLARENPGKYTHASSGSGSSGHLAMEMLKQDAKIDLVHVPYKGGAAAITDMIGGRVQVMFLNQDTLLPQVTSGKLRALAVASAKRNPAYPDTPTVAESGYPGFSAESWFGLSAPAKTPPAVIQRLNQATVKALSSPEIRQKLESVGFVVVADDPKSFSAFVDNEIAKWGKAAKASGAKMD